MRADIAFNINQTQPQQALAANGAAREKAEEFEAVFLAQMLSHMKLGSDPDGLMGGGAGEEAFQSLVADAYGRAISEIGGVGIADAVHREILRLQEAQS